MEHLEAHAHALDLLAELVRVLPEDDERLLMLGTLAVRDGLFAAGAGTEHALSQFDSTSREACDVFLTNLVRIARDDALTSARAHGRIHLSISAPGWTIPGWHRYGNPLSASVGARIGPGHD